MLVLQVAFTIKAERIDDFLREIAVNAASAVRDEPGCMRFDVLQDREDPARIHLYEVYKDDAALEAHRQVVRL